MSLSYITDFLSNLNPANIFADTIAPAIGLAPKTGWELAQEAAIAAFDQAADAIQSTTGVSPKVAVPVAGALVAGLTYGYRRMRRQKAEAAASKAEAAASLVQTNLDTLATRVSADVFSAIQDKPDVVALVLKFDEPTLTVLNRFNNKLAVALSIHKDLKVLAAAKNQAETLEGWATRTIAQLPSRGLHLLDQPVQTKAVTDAAKKAIVPAAKVF